jgi:uncharacterized protein YkwD
MGHVFTAILRVILVALATGIFGSLLPAPTSAARPSSDQVTAPEWEVLAEVNRLRGARGLAPLRMAPDVQEVARDRSSSMRRLGYFAHSSPSGRDAGDLLGARGMRRHGWGEVIGRTRRMGLGYGSRWMVDWWMDSRVHRELILSRRFDAAGVGVARDRGLTLWTIVFVM